MTYQVKLETEIGELEDWAAPFTSKAKAISFARLCARTTVMQDATRFHVDKDDMGVFTVNVRRAQ